MPELRDDSKRIMDDYVTLRLLLILAGVGMSVVSASGGFMWSEIMDNRKSIASFPAMIETQVQDNSSFQIEQRIRVWDSLNSQQQQVIALDRDQARLEGRIEEMLKALDRVIAKLDKQ